MNGWTTAANGHCHNLLPDTFGIDDDVTIGAGFVDALLDEGVEAGDGTCKQGCPHPYRSFCKNSRCISATCEDVKPHVRISMPLRVRERACARTRVCACVCVCIETHVLCSVTRTVLWVYAQGCCKCHANMAPTQRSMQSMSDYRCPRICGKLGAQQSGSPLVV